MNHIEQTPTTMSEKTMPEKSNAYTAPRILSDVQCLWTAGAALGEGTLWSVREQALYWVDILGKQLHRYQPARKARDSWAFEEEISAVAERATSNELLVTLRHRFAFFNKESGAIERLNAPERERTGNRFNDGKCDANGRFWGGTMDFACAQPTGALYRLGADRQSARMTDGYKVTNGPTWSKDGRTMYFNDTVQGRVHAFDFEPEQGTLSNQRLWRQFSAEEGFPDGMTTDAEGRLWIAHWGGAAVTCHDPESGHELARVSLPTRNITNCAFGGPDFKTLFITSAANGLTPQELAEEPLAGGLFCVQIDSPGVAANLFAG